MISHFTWCYRRFRFCAFLPPSRCTSLYWVSKVNAYKFKGAADRRARANDNAAAVEMCGLQTRANRISVNCEVTVTVLATKSSRLAELVEYWANSLPCFRQCSIEKEGLEDRKEWKRELKRLLPEHHKLCCMLPSVHSCCQQPWYQSHSPAIMGRWLGVAFVRMQPTSWSDWRWFTNSCSTVRRPNALTCRTRSTSCVMSCRTPRIKRLPNRLYSVSALHDRPKIIFC